MFINLINGLVGLLATVKPAVVQAHCDTAEGPAVKDGRTSLATGNINYALKWIPADGEAEVRDVFEKTVKVRTLGEDVAELADRLFLEALVRIHRMGEGVGFTGIQPVGTWIDPVVKAADEAIAHRHHPWTAREVAAQAMSQTPVTASRRNWRSSRVASTHPRRCSTTVPRRSSVLRHRGLRRSRLSPGCSSVWSSSDLLPRSHRRWKPPTRRLGASY